MYNSDKNVLKKLRTSERLKQKNCARCGEYFLQQKKGQVVCLKCRGKKRSRKKVKTEPKEDFARYGNLAKYILKVEVS